MTDMTHDAIRLCAPDCPACRITADEEPLDAAWAAAVAALPKTGWLSDDGRWVVPSGRWAITVEFVSSGDGYFEPYEEGYRATARMDAKTVFSDHAIDPATALRALAAALAKAR